MECGDSSPLSFCARPPNAAAHTVAQVQSGDKSPHSKSEHLLLFEPSGEVAALLAEQVADIGLP